MWYAKLNKEYYIEFVKEECDNDKLIPYEWIVALDKWTIQEIPNGFVMVKEGMILVKDDRFELFVIDREDIRRVS